MTLPPARPGRFAALLATISGASASAPWPVVAAAAVLLAGSAAFVGSRFAINTDSASLISDKLAWRQRELAYAAAFPDQVDRIAIVVDGTTPEAAERASALLADRLAARKDLFKSVGRPDGGDYFAQNGLLFLSQDEVVKNVEQLVAAQPLLGSLAADPSVRGLTTSLDLALEGVRQGATGLATLAPALQVLGTTLDGVLAGHPQPLSWQALFGARPDPRALRRFVLAQPRLDYGAIQPGQQASDFIRALARDNGLDAAHGLRVRLTGDVPLGDEELGTLQEHAGRNAAVLVGSLVAALWLATRSLRAVAAIVVALLTGLAASGAFGLAIFGSYSLLSVAFAVLFVGLGVDFGIQVAVGHRAAAARSSADDPATAPTAARIARAATLEVGVSLALAAVSIAAGFYAFGPTAYRGVSELGVIAGTGMLIAFALGITLLPALLALFRVGAGAGEMTLAGLAPIGRWVARHRRGVLVGAAAIGVACLASLPWLRFDFDPIHLRSAETESVSTLIDLARDPMTSPDTLDVLAPSLAAARPLAERLAALPEVGQVLTLASFVPEDQAPKLAVIEDAALLLDATLDPGATRPAPSDAEVVQAMRATAKGLREAASAASATDKAASEAAARVAAALDALADGPPDRRLAFADAVVPGMRTTLAQARASLRAKAVTVEAIPEALRRDWIAPDGRARIEIFPRASAHDTASFDAYGNERLRRFVAAVRTVAPEANGPPVSIQESSKTVIGAFVQAGATALVVIALLLAVALRRFGDVLRTLASLLLGGLATLGACTALGIALNYENIIALPLLFGVGVAFNIYFVVAWRRGEAKLLETSIARAVVFSALTTATAFGSLWLSSHPGTASMGELLALALACTLVSALVALPALLGPPPARVDEPSA